MNHQVKIRYISIHSHSQHQMEVSGQYHTLPLHPQQKSPCYLLHRRLRGNTASMGAMKKKETAAPA